MIKSSGINFDRNRKTKVPFGWTMVRHTTSGGNEVVMWRCPHIHFNFFTQKHERCSFYCRKDRIQNPHYHEYKIPPEEDDGLKEKYQEEAVEYTNNSYINQLEAITAKLIGENSISVSVSCSNQFCSFISEVAQLSINYFRHCKEIDQDPFKIIKPFNKNSMKRSLLVAGDEAFAQMMKNLSNYRFVNLMIDSATVNTMRVVHTTLSNPFSGMAPLPFRSVKKEGPEWAIDEYQQEIETSLAEIQSYNFIKDESEKIIVISICHDRLASQSVGISKVVTNPNIKQAIGPIVDVSCLNHLIHNSFLNTINKCAELKTLIPKIEEITTILRKREAIEFIGRKMPHPSKTRWLYICDSLLFIIRNIDKINTFFLTKWMECHTPQENQSQEEFEEQANQESMIQREIYELFFILLPLQKVSLCFECEQSRLADVIPVIQVLLRSYQKLLDDSYIQLDHSLSILHELLAQLLARLDTYLPQETWACWSFSRSGRFQIRSRNAESGIVNGSINDYDDELYSINDAALNMEKEIENIMSSFECFEDAENENIEVEEEEEKNEDQINDGEKNDNDSADREEPLDDPPENNEFDKTTIEAITNECSLNATFNKKLKDWRTNSLEDMIAYDLSLNAYEKALSVIKLYNKLLNEECTDEMIVDIFSNEDMNKENDFLVWQNFFKYDHLRFISSIALRLISLGTSESDVERLISIHRFLVHDRMSNLSSDVLLARLRMRANAISKNALMKSQ